MFRYVKEMEKCPAFMKFSFLEVAKRVSISPGRRLRWGPNIEALRAEGSSWKMSQQDDSTRARDHLANERTFLAWVRTGLAVVVFGFAIGRFAIAIREFAQAQGHPERTAGLSVWLGGVAVVPGIVFTFSRFKPYRCARVQ